jgi:hypothetical protein
MILSRPKSEERPIISSDRALLMFHPTLLGGIGMTAPRTSAMIARVIGKVQPAAITPVELSAHGRGAAGQNGSNGAPVGGQQARTILLLIRRPVPA